LQANAAQSRGFNLAGIVNLPKIFCFEYRFQRRQSR
jgi:hypothetical protein